MPSLVDEIRALTLSARAGQAKPDEQRRLAALVEAMIVERATPTERLSEAQQRLLELRDLVAPCLFGRAAQREVSTVLATYRRKGWPEDDAAGRYEGEDKTRALCFEVMRLNRRRLSASKLQKVFARSAQK